MNIVDVAGAPARRAPIPDGPTVRPLLASDSGAPVAVLHVTLPAGGRLPEHDHGPSHVVLFPLQGQVRLHYDGNDHDLGPGTATHIRVGERVSLANPGPDPAELLVVAAPPDFAAALSAWPTV
ncbi:cupin domain-containing protein [Pseudonocardia acidicola]|uniref:Cupin domain-containing protein n=1 Tax=Pseudonocardia acidicola TaxID=2724939 RepID=A0ABX1S915_9PSEU|nr:cupin domain-containing protein [Pseudonocardia acidicola]NMH97297.1 cupin domain-containing protein [Pseudonocardia acidicola]